MTILGTPGCLLLQPPLQTALETRSVALLARCASAVRQQAQQQLSSLARAIHAHPTNATNWSLAALVATQAAAGSGGVKDDYRRAGGWCRAAAAIVEARTPEQVGRLESLGCDLTCCAVWRGLGGDPPSLCFSCVCPRCVIMLPGRHVTGSPDE